MLNWISWLFWTLLLKLIFTTSLYKGLTLLLAGSFIACGQYLTNTLIKKVHAY